MENQSKTNSAFVALMFLIWPPYVLLCLDLWLRLRSGALLNYIMPVFQAMLVKAME